MFWFFGHKAYEILAPQTTIEPAPPALEGKVLTTGTPGKTLSWSFLIHCGRYKYCLISSIWCCPKPSSLDLQWCLGEIWTSLVVQREKFCLQCRKGMAAHSIILAWRILWTEEPGGLQSMGCKELDTTEWLSIWEKYNDFNTLVCPIYMSGTF